MYMYTQQRSHYTVLMTALQKQSIASTEYIHAIRMWQTKVNIEMDCVLVPLLKHTKGQTLC